MQIESLRPILPSIRAAGRMARRAQARRRLVRDLKADGTVVTQLDRQVEDLLDRRIRSAFPGVNVLSEETARSQDPDREYTFVVDPIDGTDAFSLGLPTWCVSVGLMRQFEPVAGVLYSPALELFLVADVGRPACLNGRALETPPPGGEITGLTNLVGCSSLHRLVDLGDFPGKVRNFGSAALQLVFPLVYPGLYGTVESASVHIWDILAAHAINRSLGLAFEFLSGDPLRYRELLDGRSVGQPLLTGVRANVEQLRRVLRSRS